MSADCRPLLVWRAVASHEGAERGCSLGVLPSLLRFVPEHIFPPTNVTKGDTALDVCGLKFLCLMH